MDIEVVPEKIQKRLTMRQMLFCKAYATDPLMMGDATTCYLNIYKGTIASARSASRVALQNKKIIAQIALYLSQDGFNDQNVDKQHNFLINQFSDLTVKMKGIEHYNRLKRRIENKIELILPTPIIELDEGDTIHKIDKAKAVDISDNQ